MARTVGNGSGGQGVTGEYRDARRGAARVARRQRDDDGEGHHDDRARPAAAVSVEMTAARPSGTDRLEVMAASLCAPAPARPGVVDMENDAVLPRGAL